MPVQTSHSVKLLSDSGEAHMALWRLRAALPGCVVTVRGREVLIVAPADGPAPSIERALAGIPNARAHLAW